MRDKTLQTLKPLTLELPSHHGRCPCPCRTLSCHLVSQHRRVAGVEDIAAMCLHIFPAAHNSNLTLLKKAWSSRPEPVHDVRLFTTVGHAGFNLKGRDWEMALLANAYHKGTGTHVCVPSTHIKNQAPERVPSSWGDRSGLQGVSSPWSVTRAADQKDRDLEPPCLQMVGSGSVRDLSLKEVT